MALLINMKMPDAFTDLSIIKQIWKKYDDKLGDKHLVYSGFANFIKLTGKGALDDELWSYYKINLGKKVEQKNKFVKCMTLRSTACICHVKLQVISDTFSNCIREAKFDIDVADF